MADFVQKEKNTRVFKNIFCLIDDSFEKKRRILNITIKDDLLATQSCRQKFKNRKKKRETDF